RRRSGRSKCSCCCCRRCSAGYGCGCRCSRRRWCSSAARELERPNAGGPTRATCRSIIFVHMPERAIVRRIDEHRAIVSPATTGACLVSARRNERCFALCDVIGRITGQTTSITDFRVEARAGGGISNWDVGLAVHVDAGHPAKQPIGSVVPVLLLCWRSGNYVTSHVELVPAHSRWPGEGVIGSEQDRVIGVNGFGATAVLVN